MHHDESQQEDAGGQKQIRQLELIAHTPGIKKAQMSWAIAATRISGGASWPGQPRLSESSGACRRLGPLAFDLIQDLDQGLGIALPPIELGRPLGRPGEQGHGETLLIRLNQEPIRQGAAAGIQMPIAGHGHARTRERGQIPGRRRLYLLRGPRHKGDTVAQRAAEVFHPRDQLQVARHQTAKSAMPFQGAMVFNLRAWWGSSVFRSTSTVVVASPPRMSCQAARVLAATSVKSGGQARS